MYAVFFYYDSWGISRDVGFFLSFFSSMAWTKAGRRLRLLMSDAPTGPQPSPVEYDDIRCLASHRMGSVGVAIEFSTSCSISSFI